MLLVKLRELLFPCHESFGTHASSSILRVATTECGLTGQLLDIFAIQLGFNKAPSDEGRKQTEAIVAVVVMVDSDGVSKIVGRRDW